MNDLERMRLERDKKTQELIALHERLHAVNAERDALRASLYVAKLAPEGLATPCTRQDYTVAKLDEVICKIAQDALSDIERNTQMSLPKAPHPKES